MKKLFDFFKKPPLWLLIIVAVIAVAAMVGGTLLMTQDSLYSYATVGFVLLGVMAVTLSYAIYGFVKIYPDLKSRALKWSENKPFFNKALTDPITRSIISLVISFVINMAFAVYNGSIGIMNRSIWFGALAAYYIVLTLLRGIILIYHIRRAKAYKAGQTESLSQRHQNLQQLRRDAYPVARRHILRNFADGARRRLVCTFGYNHLCLRHIHVIQNNNCYLQFGKKTKRR